jgi:hypothetical protein
VTPPLASNSQKTAKDEEVPQQSSVASKGGPSVLHFICRKRTLKQDFLGASALESFFFDLALHFLSIDFSMTCSIRPYHFSIDFVV